VIRGREASAGSAHQLKGLDRPGSQHQRTPEDFMSHIRCFDHVGITVADLDMVKAFFVGLGLEVEAERS
jgi:hypothetical protein